MAAIRVAEEIRLIRLGRPIVSGLLAGAPCAPPCWQGIVPGKTSQSEALSILRESPYVREDSIRAASAADDGGATWRWRVSSRRMSPSLQWHDSVVQAIALGLPYDLTLAQVELYYESPQELEFAH